MADKKSDKSGKDNDKPVSMIMLPKFEIKRSVITVRGTTSLIMHCWDEKVIAEMLGKQTGAPKTTRRKKDPEADYIASMYRFEHDTSLAKKGDLGFPSVAFKNSAVTAATSLGKQVVTKVAARQVLHVLNDLSPIGGEPRMRQDMVRVANGAADIRFRAEIFPWTAKLEVDFNSHMMSHEQLLVLINMGGFSVGIGEWRPERNGNHGRFEVVSASIVTVQPAVA